MSEQRAPLLEANKLAEIQKDHAFIQWKGTDVCMDWHCPCGCHNHYDAGFCYYVKCKGCGSVFSVSPHVEMVRVLDIDGIDPVIDERD